MAARGLESATDFGSGIVIRLAAYHGGRRGWSRILQAWGAAKPAQGRKYLDTIVATAAIRVPGRPALLSRELPYGHRLAMGVLIMSRKIRVWGVKNEEASPACS